MHILSIFFELCSFQSVLSEICWKFYNKKERIKLINSYCLQSQMPVFFHFIQLRYWRFQLNFHVNYLPIVVELIYYCRLNEEKGFVVSTEWWGNKIVFKMISCVHDILKRIFPPNCSFNQKCYYLNILNYLKNFCSIFFKLYKLLEYTHVYSLC